MLCLVFATKLTLLLEEYDLVTRGMVVKELVENIVKFLIQLWKNISNQEENQTYFN